MCAFTNRRVLKPLKRGSILLEAILSIVILSTSITLVIQAMTASLRAGLYSHDYTQAALLLDNKMVELLQQGFIATGLSQEDSCPLPYSQYKYFLKTAPSSTGLEETINFVKLDISWILGKKSNRISTQTYLFNQPKESN